MPEAKPICPISQLPGSKTSALPEAKQTKRKYYGSMASSTISNMALFMPSCWLGCLCFTSVPFLFSSNPTFARLYGIIIIMMYSGNLTLVWRAIGGVGCFACEPAVRCLLMLSPRLSLQYLKLEDRKWI